MNIDTAATHLYYAGKRFVGYCTMQCAKCGEVKPHSKFPNKKSDATGYDPQCKKCRSEVKKQQYRRRVERENLQALRNAV